MRKSNKKAKSDRINGLRKQYDAYLEEDKKRKERNEYILGRLDKMRISTALVPLRYKPIHEARHSTVNYIGYQPELSSVYDQFPKNQSQLFQDVQIKNNDDTTLIQEISKKFILIPKLRSPLINSYITNISSNENIEPMQGINSHQKTVLTKDSKPDINENTDWKNKYEILNLLKNEEKEAPKIETPYIDVPESNINMEKRLENNQEQVIIYDHNVNKADLYGEASKMYLNELPEKDFTNDTLKSQAEHNSKDVVFANLIQDTNTIYNENDESLTKNDERTDTTNDKLQDAKLEYRQSNTSITGVLEDVSSNYETKLNENANMLAMDADGFIKQNMDTRTDIGIVENEYHDEFNYTMQNSDNLSEEQHQFSNSEQVGYCDENEAGLDNVIKSDELQKQLNHKSSMDSNENTHTIHMSHNKDIQMEADPNVNPEEQTDLSINTTQQIEQDIEQVENPVENMNESIDEFVAEQRDMFYSEQDENYRQSDASELDYSQSVYNQQNEGYNTYYEGAQAEAYPVDLNEKEEAQRYDPNYEQQYSDSDQVKQQIEQQPQQQQYGQPVGNQPQPDLELLQFEQSFENEKQIEESLDVEDGYRAQEHVTEASVGQPHMEIDKHDIEEMRVSEEMMG